MILVAGATGALGGEICRRLAAVGETMRALVRHTADPAKLEALRQLGAGLVYGDLRDQASLDVACKDVGAVISAASALFSRQPGDSIEATDQDGQLNLVEAAKAADVSQFVFISWSGNINIGDDPCPLIVAQRRVEERVRMSGMTYTILRSSFFMETWLSPMIGFDYVNAKVTIYGDGHDRISYISLADVAEFAVQSLDNPVAYNATIELEGAEALSLLDVVAIFENVGGQRYEVTHVPVEALQAYKEAATDSQQRSFVTLMLTQAIGDVIDMNGTLRVLVIQLASVPEYAERVLAPI